MASYAHVPQGEPGYSDMEVRRDENPPGLEVYKTYADPSQHSPIAPPASTLQDKSTERVPRAGWVLPAAIAALVTAIVIGGAVGGGLGASLRSCKTSLGELTATPTNTSSNPSTCSSSPAAATTTGGQLLNYTVAPAASVYNLSVDCAALAASTQTSYIGDKYSAYCELDLLSGSRTNAAGKAVPMSDLLGIVVYSFTDCLQACSVYSLVQGRQSTGSTCGSVTFSKKVQPQLSHPGGNCWLKNSTVQITQINGPGCDGCSACTTCISGVLQD